MSSSDKSQKSRSTLKNDCSYCSCKSFECNTLSTSMNTISQSGFRESLPLPAGIYKDNLNLEVSDKSFKLTGNVEKRENEDYFFHRVSYERHFDKEVKNVELKNENGHFFIVGEFK